MPDGGWDILTPNALFIDPVQESIWQFYKN